jgi:serine/threonine protein kinase
MFDAIHFLHISAKVVHRDIKPDHFRMSEGRVKIIDFLWATDFIGMNGKHLSPKDIAPTNLTYKTSSTNAIQTQSYSRRDDLESLAYTFMFIINQNLVPWRQENELDPILNKMLTFIATDNTKISAEFRKIHKFIKEVKKLEFVEEPPYDRLRLLI